jgi:hypothetical protein
MDYMSKYLEKLKFKEINLDDPFFNSLKSDYLGFEEWFKRKDEEETFVKHKNNLVEGFLYLKLENGPIEDVFPIITCGKALKIGTFKINPHGTRLGERFIKKALDYAVFNNAELCYVTIFERHEGLINLFAKYGFVHLSKKSGPGESELVFIKNLKEVRNDILFDYPLINTKNKQKFLLAIYPQYHSVMFPDSILKNENVNILEDVTITNSIHKTYVTRMSVNRANPGDIFVIYRTKTEDQSAEYTSVATSVCVVEEVKSQYEFKNFEDFFKYATTYSIFDRDDLKKWYDVGKCYAIKMTYNAALSKRLIRKKLIEEIGLDRQVRWSFIKITDNQFYRILEEGGVSESLIID